ncbi:hypothetical protein ASF49_15585 [Methylobacterium sp. Leaf104]|jgi:hypothetical protein|uniref:hypothetical protein n=1 Tax=Methylobacterium TaxID=407 RepID=UPI0006F65D32|nr:MULTISPECIES: hypothetical protein [Methylobacterium]KQO42462.1 hypothetical protein ASF08_12695 [Methylobacterium sp. Leaf85]KQP29580.1 hypothetical protein ASF49_15585 [Methylobacterium sp. Leaf104]KQQ24221.1 hypothetical protein ASF58_16710 [Methylobacterium sp. Leaf125]MCI9881876.1 hypothetical protein [Methylobacterium goesingense]
MIRSCPIHDGYTDDALRPFGWSSGLYSFRCRDCRERAVGEKRSQRCRTCAVAALRKAEAYPPSAEQASAPVTRFAVRDTVTGLLFCNRSMHPNRKEWDGLATAQVYLKREAAEATARQVREQWEDLRLHHPTLFPERLEAEVVEVQLMVVA